MPHFSPDQFGCAAGPMATKAASRITRYTPQCKSQGSRDVGTKPWHDTPQANKLMHISCSYQCLPNSTTGNDSVLRIACSTKLHFTCYGTRLQTTPGKHQDNCWDPGLALCERWFGIDWAHIRTEDGHISFLDVLGSESGSL